MIGKEDKKRQILITIPEDSGNDLIQYINSIESNYKYLINDTNNMFKNKKHHDLFNNGYNKFYEISGYEIIILGELIPNFENFIKPFPYEIQNKMKDFLTVAYIKGKLKGYFDTELKTNEYQRIKNKTKSL